MQLHSLNFSDSGTGDRGDYKVSNLVLQERQVIPEQ